MTNLKTKKLTKKEMMNKIIKAEEFKNLSEHYIVLTLNERFHQYGYIGTTDEVIIDSNGKIVQAPWNFNRKTFTWNFAKKILAIRKGNHGKKEV